MNLHPRDPGTWALLPVSITDALANLNAMQPASTGVTPATSTYAALA